MKWIKKGRIFSPNGDPDWMTTHAWVPTAENIKNDLYRIYFATRNKQNLSQIGYVLIDINKPTEILEVSKMPVLELGPLGAFDDSGVFPSCIVDHDSKKYMYYVGWMQGVKVPFYAALALAISLDGGKTYQKYSRGPLLSRNDVDPYITATADVKIEVGLWKMWYVSGTQWTIENNKPKPHYLVKYAESEDGINWKREGKVCIDFKTEDEYAIARPWVIKEDGIYKMWFSYRGERYRIGYAESEDGIDWERKDEQVGIDLAASGWDSEMIACTCVFEHKGSTYMLYNGNNCGKTGIGYAIMEKT